MIANLILKPDLIQTHEIQIIKAMKDESRKFEVAKKILESLWKSRHASLFKSNSQFLENNAQKNEDNFLSLRDVQVN